MNTTLIQKSFIITFGNKIYVYLKISVLHLVMNGNMMQRKKKGFLLKQDGLK